MQLPSLRQDLRLLPGNRTESGEASWLLYDPLRHQYFSLSRSALRLMRLWRGGETRDRLDMRIEADGLDIAAPEVDSFIGFIEENFLAEGQDDAHVGRLSRAAAARQKHWLVWLVHNYLFFKIPLLRPDALLGRILPAFRWMANRPTRLTIYALGLYGALAVIWQWEQFLTTFLYFFTWQGLVAYGAALIAVKAAHELGHALVAKHFGLRVSSMGLAFLVLFPVLYTDNTDAWRLTDTRKRLRIVLAGLMVELHIAVISLFGWAVLDDGPLRSAAFLLATTSLIGSLAVNLSPFMRFDGYYALADYLKMDNLQPRAFALARWQLRQWLFALPENAPEPFEPWRHNILVIYSYLTWIYRFFLFLGIALLVYHFAFKLLGIILFVVEIVWFILRPIWAEMKRWWDMRASFSLNRRSLRSLLFVSLTFAVLFLPWRSSISVPAVLEAEQQVTLFPSEPARLKQLVARHGANVRAGDVLAVLESPPLSHEINLEQRRIRLLETQIAQQVGSREMRTQRFILEERLIESRAHLQGLRTRAGLLTLKAPRDGRLDLDRTLAAGQWLKGDVPIGFIANADAPQLVGYIQEGRLTRIEGAPHARFVSDDGLHAPYHGMLVAIDKTAAKKIEYPALLSTHNGPIAVRQSNEGDSTTPEAAYFKAQFSVLTPRRINHSLTGQLQIDTARYSPASDWIDGILAILVRETGF